MARWVWIFVLGACCAYAQSAASLPANASRAQGSASDDGDLFPAHKPEGKVGLVRGILRQVDPIYDQLVIHSFGGGDLRIGFDLSTKFSGEKKPSLAPNIPAGSVVAVDTVVENGNLYALSVRRDRPTLTELNGQVVEFDPARSRLTLRDPLSPETVSLGITAGTNVIAQGQSVAPQTLSPGMLVRVWFPAGQESAKEVEILAKPGTSFTFEGRIVAVDLRSRVLALSNISDQSLRELVFGPLDRDMLARLREGNEVAICAEFDGQQYQIRTVTLLPRRP